MNEVSFILKDIGKQNRVDLSGEHKVVLTQANHAFCSGKVSINGVEHTYTMHLYCAGGNWVPPSLMKSVLGDIGMEDCYLSRGMAASDVSRSARDKGCVFIPYMFSQAIRKVKDLSPLRIQAEKNFLRREIESLQPEIKEKKQELQVLSVRSIDLSDRLHEAEKGIFEDSYQK